MRTGRVESVWIERRGTQLVADAPEGTQVLDIAFTGDFDEDGGQLYHVPSGTVYDYSAFDANAETLTLSAPLPTGVSFADGDAIRVFPLADDAYALVRLEDVESDEPITARVIQALRASIPEGQREPGMGEVVQVENSGQEWVVQDAVGTTRTILVGDPDGARTELNQKGFYQYDSTNTLTTFFGDDEIPGQNLLILHGDENQLSVQRGNGQNEITLYTHEPFPGLGQQSYIDIISANGETYRLAAEGGSPDTFAILAVSTSTTEMKIRPGVGIYFEGTGSRGPIAANDGWLKHVSDSSGAAFVIEDWNDLTLINGWSHQAGHLVPGYKLHATGSVELCGGLTGGTTANGTPIATLPSGYIPSADVRIPIMSNANPTGGETRLVIRGITTAGGNPSGTVEIYGVGAGASLSLDGCTFPVDR